jgi:hypothetical protein
MYLTKKKKKKAFIVKALITSTTVAEAHQEAATSTTLPPAYLPEISGIIHDWSVLERGFPHTVVICMSVPAMPSQMAEIALIIVMFVLG